VDAVHGFSHPFDAPLFPHAIGMGATWDSALAERAGSVTGQALRATGWVENFAPVQDVYRDNRWGRAYEPWSEEPTLAGALGAANVRGMQSAGGDRSDANPLHVAATLKHFAGNSQSVNGHDRVEGLLPMRYLQDIFLPAYKDAIDANARMVMVSSSSINGVPATASRFLQTTLLRQRLGFNGVTISDYKDVQAIATDYHAAPDAAGAIAMAVNAGLDMAMWVDAPDQWQSNILTDVEQGQISQSRIDEAVRRILTLKFELGLFDQPCMKDPSNPCVEVDAAEAAVQAGRDATLDAARESITLLKNDNNVLPIATNANVLVTGPNADSMVGQLGGWSVGWQGIATSDRFRLGRRSSRGSEISMPLSLSRPLRSGPWLTLTAQTSSLRWSASWPTRRGLETIRRRRLRGIRKPCWRRWKGPLSRSLWWCWRADRSAWA
jgi:beta-glucosidase